MIYIYIYIYDYDMISDVTLTETNIHGIWMKIIYLNSKIISSAKKKEKKQKEIESLNTNK